MGDSLRYDTPEADVVCVQIANTYDLQVGLVVGRKASPGCSQLPASGTAPGKAYSVGDAQHNVERPKQGKIQCRSVKAWPEEILLGAAASAQVRLGKAKCQTVKSMANC